MDYTSNFSLTMSGSMEYISVNRVNYFYYCLFTVVWLVFKVIDQALLIHYSGTVQTFKLYRMF